MSSGVIELFNQLARNDFGFFQKIASVADVMSSEFKMITLDHTYEQIAELFRQTGFQHAPVAADDGDVVGIVSDRDLCRFRPPRLGTAAEADDDHRVLQVPAAQFMTRGVISVPTSSPLLGAVRKMLEHHIDSVLVHDDSHQVKGIITPHDLMKLIILFHQVCTRDQGLERLRLVDLDVSRGLPLDAIFSRGARSVRDVMTRDAKCLSEKDSIQTAMELMQSLRVRHLPVISTDKRLAGMVSDREILRELPPISSRPDQVENERFRSRLFATDAPVVGSVAAIMDTQPSTVSPDGLFVDAVNQLVDTASNALPVVEDGKLVGILTTMDVLRVLGVILQIVEILPSHAESKANNG